MELGIAMYRERVNKYINQMRSNQMSFFKRGFFVVLGASLVAISLQLFLVKNDVIDGGIIGICLLIAQISRIDISLLILLLNTPFLALGSIFLGKRFLVYSLLAIFVLAMEMNLLETFPEITNNLIIVIIIGGFILGMGVGMIIRFGGSLDGTEILAILLSERSTFSIGQYIMIFNFFIFASSIFVFGFKEAIYSLATFMVAYRTIDFSLNMN
jgi:uncharacterized membrane-anchored protein YitT (DUF2179 family)